MMTSREIVKRCIGFEHPPRCGWHFSVDPIQGKVWNESDFYYVGPKVSAEFEPKPGQTEWVTEWGDKRSRINTQIGESVESPLKEWSDLNSYKMPDLAAPARNIHLKTETEKGHHLGKYVYGYIPSQMLLPIDLRGIENWFMDNACEKDNLCQLLDMISTLRDRMIDNYYSAGVDGVITWDDMGTNSGGFVSPATFREIYLPRYKHTINYLHARGMHFMHHCCGQVREYMNMFIEAGCDVIQLDQPELMGIDWLSENYAGKICFWNCVDIQKTIGKNDLNAIALEAKKQVDKLSKNGGFMVKAYQQPESIGMSIEESEVQYQTFKKYGYYEKLAGPE